MWNKGDDCQKQFGGWKRVQSDRGTREKRAEKDSEYNFEIPRT